MGLLYLWHLYVLPVSAMLTTVDLTAAAVCGGRSIEQKQQLTESGLTEAQLALSLVNYLAMVMLFQSMPLYENHMAGIFGSSFKCFMEPE